MFKKHQTSFGWYLIIAIHFLYVFTSFEVKAQDIPLLKEPVTDFTNTLDYSQWTTLSSKVRFLEDSTSIQIAIVIIPSLNGADIRDYAIDLLQKNKIGQKGKDNGVLLLVAKDDKKIAIEVGYGLEGVLPDALCNQIIRNEIKPRFRESDFNGGLVAALDAIIKAAHGEYRSEGKGKKNIYNFGAGTLVLFVILSFLFSMIRGGRSHGISSRGYRSSMFGGSGFGGGFGGWSSGGGGGGWSAGGGSFGGGGASGSW
jgi:uncharacterized protein